MGEHSSHGSFVVTIIVEGVNLVPIGFLHNSAFCSKKLIQS